jgi:hypothetical protein
MISLVLASFLLAGVLVEDVNQLQHGKLEDIQAHVHAHLTALRQFAQRMLPAIAPTLASRPPPACNISYSPLPGPKLRTIAASPSSGMLWGIGDGVRVQQEPWMEPISQRRDALWVCGSVGAPCAGLWRLLDGPAGVSALAVAPEGGLYMIDSSGRVSLKTETAMADIKALAPLLRRSMAAIGYGPTASKPSIAASPAALAVSHPSGSLRICADADAGVTCQMSAATGLHSLSVQPQTSALWAIHESGTVQTAAEPARAMLASGWDTVKAPEAITSLVAGPTALRAVATDGRHLKCPWPCKGSWKEVPGHGGSLAEGGNLLYHLTDSGHLSVSQPC